MKDLKIRVANEAESKEVQELLDILGYSKDAFDNKSTPCWIAICDGLTYSDYNIGKNIWYTACPKEITIQELRDMVNPMKEYLEKQADGSYKLVMRGIVGKDDDIEAPEGAEIYTKNDADGNVFYRKGLDFLDHFDNKWLPTKYSTNGFIEEMKRNGRTVLWQREKKSIIDKLVDENLPEFKHDFVNHPKHYCDHPSGIECIEITRHHDFAIGNAIKYLWRAGLKDSNNEIQDLKKAVWYIQDKIAQLENK